jgi:hypothetical protein
VQTRLFFLKKGRINISGIFQQPVVEVWCLTLTDSVQHFMVYMGLSPLMDTCNRDFITDQYNGKSKLSDIA